MQKIKSFFTQLTLWLAFATTFVSGQQVPNTENIIKVDTRAVFIDVLVRDKTNGEPITDLRREDFTLKVDNKEQEIVDFSFDGKTNCPLTIILFLNFAPNGALKYLEQPKSQKSLSKSLAKLGENDEVAVLTINDWFVGKPQFIMQPTRDWEEVSKNIAEAANDVRKSSQVKSPINNDPMTEAISLVEKLAQEKPDKQFAFVYISDEINTLDTMNFANRQRIGENLIKNKISFSALNFYMDKSYQVAANIINPLGYAFGLSVSGSSNYLAKESGGVSLQIPKAEDFGASLEKILNLYSSRYSLGFYLDEKEKNEGKKHKIEVKIKDSSKANLLIHVKRGFYLN